MYNFLFFNFNDLNDLKKLAHSLQYLLLGRLNSFFSRVKERDVNMKYRTLKFAAPLFAVLLLQGCIYVKDDGGRRDLSNRGTTIGEELEDLEDAFEDGLLNRQEYDRLRNRILND